MQNHCSLFKNFLHAPFSLCAGKSCRRPSNAVIFLLSAWLYVLTMVLPVTAMASTPPVAGFSDMPLEYGKVIYRINENSPKQLYIIGISHRDPETGRNGSTTIQTQTDIFRIGEWLHRNRELQLLLPEGYFTAAETCPPALAHSSSSQLDSYLLRQKLADESRFVNAEMLLKENCRLRVSQVEDRSIYDAVFQSLRNLKTTGTAQSSPQERLAQLQYLQEVRTAVLLQKIPAIVDRELNDGMIHNQSAMFTIGLNHLQDIVRYFQNNAIKINSPDAGRMQPANYTAELNLLKNGFGVTIIIPRTLADDRRLLQMTNLDRILLAYGRTGQEWLN